MDDNSKVIKPHLSGKQPDFQLLVPTYSSFEVEMTTTDIQNVLASISLIRRDGTLVGPTLLKVPKDTQTSPQGSLVIEANEFDVRENGQVTITKKNADLQNVHVLTGNNLADTQVVLDGTAQTKLVGIKEPMTQDRIQDNAIVVNREGAFLINVLHKNHKQLNFTTGVRDTTLSTDNLLVAARGQTLITNAR